MYLKRIAIALLAAPWICAAQEQTAAPAPSSPPGLFQGRPSVPENVEVLHDVEFGKGGGRPLHAEIARPKDSTGAPMPAVLWIHGGGWSVGSYKGNPALFLAAKGYFTASIEYRLSGEAPWPAQIEDCKLAVRWLRANAKKYNIDPNGIGVWGHSAGGHLVACLGTMGDEPALDGTGGYPGVSSKVEAVVDASGPVDFYSSHVHSQQVGAKAQTTLDKFFGATFEERPDIWKEASPINHIHAGDPPFLIIHGDHDQSVRYDQSANFAAALEKAGVPVQFITVKGGSHNLDAAPGQPTVEPDKKAQRELIEAFFDKNLRKQAS